MRAPALINSAVLLAFLAGIAECGQLPIRAYTTAEGLAHNSVHRIVADSRGFLWFATSEGLSRFDGYQFTNYGTEQGLPHRAVYDLTETRQGIYWLATPAGLCRFDPRSKPAFRAYVPAGPPGSHWINTILQDGEGALWCGTRNGLYRFDVGSGSFQRIDFVAPQQTGDDAGVREVLRDHSGVLWVAAGSGLYRYRGQIWERFTARQGLPTNDALSLIEDSRARLWVGTTRGLCQISAEASVLRTLRSEDGLPDHTIQCLREQSGGGLWIGTKAGLAELGPQSSTPRAYTTRHGLSNSNIESLAEDREGNLWIGTDGGGVMRSPRAGFLSFSAADGLAPGAVVSIQESRGRVSVLTRDGARLWRNDLEGDRFVARRLNLPAQISNAGWGWGQLVAEDGRGRTWVATGQGPVVFAGNVGRLARGEAFPFLGPHESNVFRLFSDKRHTIWISTSSTEGNGLASLPSGAVAFRLYARKEGLGSVGNALWSAFAEDRYGNLWIGSLETSEVARYANGSFTVFTEADGLPKGEIRSLYSDRVGRLWMASGASGLVRVDDPGAAHPHFRAYGAGQGLASNFTTSLAEDRWGRIYVGTAKGVDRLEPASGRVRRYTSADGLARGEIQVGFNDAEGNIWFGGPQGVCRLTPEPDRPDPPSPVLITGIRVAGAPYGIDTVGQNDVSGLELQPGQSQLRLEFAGIGFGETLRYQFKLEGAGADWSSPTDQRGVEYAGLAPGSYRFLVRALTAGGVESTQPASVRFTVIAPVWRRWWFLALALLAASLLVLAAHRYRVRRLLEVERVRTRIATDLHDDIGSSLSQIAILSEVVRRRVSEQDPKIQQPLSHIADTSREAVDAMGEIVWAIHPGHDRLDDLTTRMRHFASTVLGAREIGFDFHGPEPAGDLKIDDGVRRQVFLIFKEALNNIVRHASCSHVKIDFAVGRGWLTLVVRDNGTGLGTGTATGNGLSNIRRRAEAMGGTVTVLSQEREGVEIALAVPLRNVGRSHWPRFLHN